MRNHNRRRGQSNQYDKIIKENIEVTLPEVIREVLGLEILQSVELPDDVQHTKERKPDALKKVTDIDGNTYILHIEFQVEDEQEMVYRMAEYSIMLMRKYQLPIKQYVIFLRETKPRMPTALHTPKLVYSFDLIMIAGISYKLFIKSDNPEVKMLAILANFDEADREDALKSIVTGLLSHAKGDFAERRYFKQLRIFMQLRNNIEEQFDKIMDSVSTFFKEENDYFYRKGEVKGEARKSRAVVENLIAKLGFTDEQAAEIAEVTVDFVRDIRAGLRTK